MRAFPAVTERIVAFDETDRTLTYEATGLPAFVGEARSTWRVTPLGQQRARARFDGVLATRGELAVSSRCRCASACVARRGPSSAI